MKSSKESSYNNLFFKILNVIRNYAYDMHTKKTTYIHASFNLVEFL